MSVNLPFRRDIALGVKNLLLHKLRSILTMLGLVFGVGSVIAMLAIGEGASLEALERIRRLGSHNVMIESVKPTEDAGSKQKSSFLSVYGLKYADAEHIAKTIPTVDRLVPVKSFVKNCRFLNREQELRIVSTTADWFGLVNRETLAGRVLSERDCDTFATAAVLTEWGARRLLANEHAIGERLTIDGNVYQVVGIVRSSSGDADSDDSPDRRTDVYIPLSTARQRHGDVVFRRLQGASVREQVELHSMIVHVAREKDVAATAAAVERVLEISHPRRDYRVSVPLQLLHEAEATKRTFSIVLGAIAGISLLVGGIGIMNIMLASVTERTREIGIRRAIGAKRRQIVAQFLIEALVLSVIGGMIGMLVGVTIPTLVTMVAGMPTVITFWSITLSFGISVAVGIGFGIYPAIRASRLDPIVALRYE